MNNTTGVIRNDPGNFWKSMNNGGTPLKDEE
jgi:hypothetical protein